MPFALTTVLARSLMGGALLGASFGGLLAQDPPTVAAHITFQPVPTGPSCNEFHGVAERATIDVPAGQPFTHTVGVSIVTQIGRCGETSCLRCDSRSLQGWSMSVGFRGDLTIISVDGMRPEYCAPAFEVTRVVDPTILGADGQPQGQGIINAVVFFCGDAYVLNPRGTETIAEIKLESGSLAGGESARGELFCHEGLAPKAELRPTMTQATVDGQSRAFESCRPMGITFRAASLRYRRCDSDHDGRLSISDVLAVLDWLFRRSPAIDCRSSADCDGNRSFDVSDAVFALNFVFRGGPPPPAPFPDCASAPAGSDCRVQPASC